MNGQTTALEPISHRSVLAAVIGNALEWFDFVVYGFFAAVIARLFFPTSDPFIALMLALGTFGVSFLIRPVGAIVIGRYADRAGRRKALVLVSTLMLVGTFMIAVMPTYAQIGIAAPILLLLARLIQGFSAGGEFGSATAYLAEQSPSRRGFYSSWQFASQGAVTLLASAFGLGITLTLNDDQITSWGWRLPFFFGLLIGPVAYFLRYHAAETPEFNAALSRNALPQRAPLGPIVGRIAVGCGAGLVGTVALYLMLYMPTYAQTALGLDASVGFAATFATGIVLIVITPFAGIAADRYGRLAVAIPPVIALILLPLPLFLWMIAAPDMMRVVIVQLVIVGITAVYLGALPAFLVELFPVETRTTGLSLCYNIAVVTAGGFAPLIFALLVRETGSNAAPSFYLVLAAAASLATLIYARRRGWAN